MTFHLTDGKKISCRARLGDFSGQLSDSSFLRCHQSFCINMEKVTSLKKNSFVVGQTEIPISRTYLKTARKKYKDYFGGAEGLLLTAPFGYVTITMRFHVVE